MESIESRVYYRLWIIMGRGKKMKRKRIKKKKEKNDGMHGKLESWPSNRLLVRACETMRAKSVKTGL